MSLQRSPPGSRKGSQQDLSKLRDDSPASSQRKRKERPCDCNYEQLLLDVQNNLKLSIKSTLEQQNIALKSTLDAIRDDVGGLKSQMSEFQVSFKRLSDEQSVLRNDVSSLKTSQQANTRKVESLTKDVAEMRSKVTDMSNEQRLKEQQGRVNNLEIAGIPVIKSENLIDIVHRIAQKIGFDLRPGDIDYVHRVRRFITKSDADSSEAAGSADGALLRDNSSNIPNIIVRFVQRYRKSQMLAAVRARRGLTTVDVGLDGRSSPIFVSEHLTPQNKLLHKQVRQLAKDKDYKYVWASDCKILVRKSDNTKIIHISGEKDLTKIK